MKIIINNKIYIQKKDLELIIDSNKDIDNIPNSIINKYNENKNIDDFDFIVFNDNSDIDYLNSFWFIINYNDLIDFCDLELHEYIIEDLTHLRQMRVEYDKHKYLGGNKVYTNIFEIWSDELSYFCFIPSIEEAKKYPIDFRLLYNKVSDMNEIGYLNTGVSKVNLPEEVTKPIHYSKKQLQKIYYEVLSQELSFAELKPYEKQLYCIFTKIDYTPEVLDIIKKIILINRNNLIDFIQDDLLDLVLRLEGKQTKFEECTYIVIDYLYAIGYNKFDNFESKAILEKDISIIKKIIRNIMYSKIDNESLETLKKYNDVLANITLVLKKCDFKNCNLEYTEEMFLNMLVFVYFKPNIINYDYDFLKYVYDYLDEHDQDFIEQTESKYERNRNFGDKFIKNFNYSNALLLKLYEGKNDKISIKKPIK